MCTCVTPHASDLLFLVSVHLLAFASNTQEPNTIYHRYVRHNISYPASRPQLETVSRKPHEILPFRIHFRLIFTRYPVPRLLHATEFVKSCPQTANCRRGEGKVARYVARTLRVACDVYYQRSQGVYTIQKSRCIFQNYLSFYDAQCIHKLFGLRCEGRCGVTDILESTHLNLVD